MSLIPEDAERCADVLDQATNVSQAHNDSVVEAARRLAAPEQDGSITECVDCDNDLGGRTALFKVRCILCQERLERKRGGYGVV